MKFFNLDSPFMQALNKVGDLMVLNLLALLCCIPIVTVGASLTALHYMVLKLFRNEDCYVVRGFFKSFKDNFKQATLIWLLMLVVLVVLGMDFAIIFSDAAELPFWVASMVIVATLLVVFTSLYVFPCLAKFVNPIGRTLKNALYMSILQLPKTLLMLVMYLIPVAIAVLIPQLFPIAFLFGLSAPAFGSAALYNKLFKKLEDQVLEEHPELAETVVEDEDDGERIFSDKLIIPDEEINDDGGTARQ